MDLKLTGALLLVRYYRNEGLTNSGLWATEPEDLPKYRAQVEQIGPNVTECKVGDDVLFRKHAGEEVHMDGNTYYILNEADLDAVLVYAEDEQC
jgi:co-chaperonin GroES (HSP10)